MNILIVDTDQINLAIASEFSKEYSERLAEEMIIIPKGIDIMRDVSIDWMIMIRDELDRRIKAACME